MVTAQELFLDVQFFKGPLAVLLQTELKLADQVVSKFLITKPKQSLVPTKQIVITEQLVSYFRFSST